MDISAHFSAFPQEHGDGILVEAIFIKGAAAIHHTEEGVLIDDVALQCRHTALRGAGTIKKNLHDITVFPDDIAVMQDIGLIVCAYSGDFGIRFFVHTAGFS